MHFIIKFQQISGKILFLYFLQNFDWQVRNCEKYPWLLELETQPSENSSSLLKDKNQY